MAAQDLQISSYRAPLHSQSFSAGAEPDDRAGINVVQILLSTLRRWWLLMLLAVLVSGAGAYGVATWLGKQSAVASATLLYAGLPSMVDTNVSETIGPGTGIEMMVSVPVLERLRERRNLTIPANVLALMVQTKVGRNSALMKVTMSWSDPEEAVAILNDLLDVFVDEMASQRKLVLQGYVDHADMTVLKQKMQVDDARRQRNAFVQEQTQKLEGGRTPTDRYRAAFEDAERAAQTVEEKRVVLKGLEEQVAAVDQERAAIDVERRKLLLARKQAIIDKLLAAISTTGERYARHTTYSKVMNQLQSEVSRFHSFSKHGQDFAKWDTDLTELVADLTGELHEVDREGLVQANRQLLDYVAREITSFDTKLVALDARRQQLQTSGIPLKNEIALLEKRQVASALQAESLSGEAAAAASTTQMSEADQKLDEVEEMLRMVTLQRDGLRLLQESKINEWSVSVPAMMETTVQSSNRRKVFIVSLGLCSLALCAPFFLAEWHAQREPPQVKFARSLNLPVLAQQEGALAFAGPATRRIESSGDEAQRESMRMLTLRIQQTCHRSGSVVLFSSLDPRVSAAATIASVAECLADREERVLLVDAVSPDRTLTPILNLFASGNSAAEPVARITGKAEAATAQVPMGRVVDPPGLAEYFLNEYKSTSDLIRPTNCPGVDLIASGSTAFHREALASSTLTELLNTCRQNYTMILVHGPAATWAADLQMLAARADGVVLTASKRVARDPQVREVVEDLMNLGAPIVGVVA